MNMGEPLKIAADVAGIFETLGIQYMIGGSMASSLFGIPRATQDVDFIVMLKRDQITLLCNELEGAYYYSEPMIRDAVKRAATFNIIHLETMFKVDVFVAGKGSHSEIELTRRVPFELEISGSNEVYLTSPEDLIIEKLIWYEKGHRISSNQLNDVKGIIKIQKTRLDWDYLRGQAVERNVSDLLNQILRE
ncbi:MAG TPA: hypothetical protein PLV45_08575 [bacterium]|nr:hypothetical protein [bacterium]